MRALLPPSPFPCPDVLSGWPPFPREGEGTAPGAPYPFAGLFSLFLYEGPAREGIRLAKYGGMSRLAPPIAAGLSAAIRGPWAERFPSGFRPVVVPVPISPWKYLRRGYNFPALVGRILAGLSGWPFDPLLLRRTRGGCPQAGLPLAKREANVRRVFSAARGARAPACVLLVDDVYTSGATAAACARALKTAGARAIVVVTAARAIP